MKARDTKAVVVCSPTSVKAFLLSLLECFHLLSNAHQMGADTAGYVTQLAGAAMDMLSKVGEAAKRAVGANVTTSAEARLRSQVARCVKVYDVLQGAALLLDEVDLVLHPLKCAAEPCERVFSRVFPRVLQVRWSTS